MERKFKCPRQLIDCVWPKCVFGAGPYDDECGKRHIGEVETITCIPPSNDGWLGPTIDADELAKIVIETQKQLEDKAKEIASGMKPSNPKDAIGSTKIPLHLWPAAATIAGSLGLLDGMLKYGRANWREVGIKYSIYIDALLRHTYKLFEGEDIDEDSGLPHECHILACAGIIVDAKAAGKLIDDRQYPGQFPAYLKTMTPHVARLLEKHVDKNPHHYTIQDVKKD